MTRIEAHALLDAATDGADVPTEVITAALQATGDLPEVFIGVPEPQFEEIAA